MKTVCLITPGHLSTNPRLVKEADAIVSIGHKVVVISADFMTWAREFDRGFRDRAWRSVRRVPFGPQTRLSTRILHAARQRLARGLFRVGLRRQGVIRTAWHPIAPDLLKAAVAVKADLYIAHYPAALPAAAMAARTHGARYAFDAEDFHLGDPPETTAYDEQRDLTRAIESEYLPGCAYVTAASPGIADAYAADYGITRPSVLRNVFPRSNAPPEPTPRGRANPGPSLYWFSQTIGEDRGLECAVRALALSHSAPQLYLRGNPQPGFIDKLRAIAVSVGVAKRLHLLPLAAPWDMERLATVYDMGLVAETGLTPNHRIALTNKLFSYALAGIPALISDIPAHREYASEAGGAVRVYPVDDPVALAQAIDQLLGGDGSELAVSRAKAYALGQERLNWDTEQAILARLVAEIFG